MPPPLLSLLFLICFLCTSMSLPSGVQRVTSAFHQGLSSYQSSSSLWPTRLLCLWDSPGKNTGLGSHSRLQGIFLTQGSQPALLHCRKILYCLSHQGSPQSSCSSYIYAVFLLLCQENALVIPNTLFQQHKRRLYTWTSPDGQHRHQIDDIYFAAKDGEALYSQQKQDQELTVAHIMNSLLPNSD